MMHCCADQSNLWITYREKLLAILIREEERNAKVYESITKHMASHTEFPSNEDVRGFGSTKIAYDEEKVHKALAKYHEREADIYSKRQMLLEAGFLDNFETQLSGIGERDNAWTKDTCLCEPEKLMERSLNLGTWDL